MLAGVAVSSLAAAITSFVIFWAATGDSYRDVLNWLLGSLAGARWPAVAIAGGAMIVIGIPLALSGRVLDAFAFGDTTAASLGFSASGRAVELLGASALLTGALVSVSGSIGFVGLVLPHAVRLLVGPGNRALLPLSTLVGGIFLIWADTLARTVFDPRELPVGHRDRADRGPGVRAAAGPASEPGMSGARRSRDGRRPSRVGRRDAWSRDAAIRCARRRR